LTADKDAATTAVARGASFLFVGDAEEEALVDSALRISPSLRASFRSLSSSASAVPVAAPVASRNLSKDMKFMDDVRIDYLDDGSPSTVGVSGRYTGSWNLALGRPDGGPGVMRWDNGITASCTWKDGVYHGYGSKLYSKGGGYEGDWVHGKRHGQGVTFYSGKWGYDRWEGPFEEDVPHGMGTMHLYGGTDPVSFPFQFVRGKPLS
jgi:hypothetical protein